MERLGKTGVIVVALVAIPSCEPASCTAMGCPSTHHTFVQVASTESAFEPLSVSLCFNDQCNDFTLEAPNSSGGSTPSEDPAPVANVASVSCDGPCELRVDWMAGPDTVLSAGDRFAVTVTTEAGAVVIQQMEVVDGYSYAYPNGRECDEDSCRVVSGVTRQ